MMATTKPSLTYTPGASWVDLIITNPAPGSGETAATGNSVYKRETGTSTWVRIAIVGVGATYRDYALRSASSYDYRIDATSASATTSSDVVTVASPRLVGMWFHDPSNPSGTIIGFPYLGSDREENLEIETTGFQFIGRPRKVYELSDYEDLDVALSVFVPFSNTHDAEIAWWRARKRARRVLLYRDNRGRILYGVLGDIGLTDERTGTTIKTKLMSADYIEAV